MNMDDGGTSVGTPLSTGSGGGDITAPVTGGQQTIGSPLTTAATQTVTTAAASSNPTASSSKPAAQVLAVSTISFRRPSLGRHYRRLIFD